jgi:cell division protein FtsI/penicillin-binding protein 2
MGLQREISRWWEILQRRKQRRTSAAPKEGEPVDVRWGGLRWWFLPIFVLCVGGWAAWVLWKTTEMADSPYGMVILDAPLPSALRTQPWFGQDRRYFILQPQTDPAQVVLSRPGQGVRAYRGQEGVPLFGAQTPLTELFLPPCDAPPEADATYFYTGDGMILWACLQDHERIALYRVGWRFSEAAWRKGRSLGYSADNAIVMGGAMLPLHSATLRLQGNEMRLRPEGTCLSLPPHTAPSEDTLTPQDPPKDAEETATQATVEGATQEAKPCDKSARTIAAGMLFRLHSPRFPHRAVTFRWQRALQPNEGIDLWLHPALGEGTSIRVLSIEGLRLARQRGFLVGRADLYFRDILPDATRTRDLEEVVHRMVLSGALHYLEGDDLRKRLEHPPFAPAPLDTWLAGALQDQQRRLFSPLQEDPFLRNRLAMVNQALARGDKTRARALFRLQRRNDTQKSELLGLGIGSIMLQSPRRNLLSPRQQRRSTQPDLRLQTTLTARRTPRPFLIEVLPEPLTSPPRILYLHNEQTEVIALDILPKEAKKRRLSEVLAVANGRALIWHNDQWLQSPDPFFATADALQEQPSTPSTTSDPSKSSTTSDPSKPSTTYDPSKPSTTSDPSKPSTTSDPSKPSANTSTQPSEGSEPSRFLYRVTGRWWQREPGRQRSSTWWPLQAIARQLAAPSEEEALARLILEANRAQVQTRPHCGNQSVRQGKRWVHRPGCWESTTLFAQDAMLVIPCGALLREALRKQRCRAGQPTVTLDRSGQPLLPPITSYNTPYHGIVISKTTDASGIERYFLVPLKESQIVQRNHYDLAAQKRYPLRDGDLLLLGKRQIRFSAPPISVAYSRFQGDRIVPVYPHGPLYGHVVAGSVGGPYRNHPADLRTQIPPPPTASANGALVHDGPRKIALTLDPDLQQIAFRVGLQHFSRLDSAAFQQRFRRRFFRNPDKPHAGAILLLERKQGQVLTALTFPALDPNPPAQTEALQDQSERAIRYFYGQILDAHDLTRPLLAYRQGALPPDPPSAARRTQKPPLIPSLLEALAWEREEEQRGIRPMDRSGWLTERAIYGSLTPGSTAKIVTASAYARFLRQQGRPVRFPKHQCAGGMMFQLQRRIGDKQTAWRDSPIHFRCHKRGGHGHIDLQTALAVSCNVYFAKLALAMVGIPEKQLDRPAASVRWHASQNSGTGRYEVFRFPADSIAQHVDDPKHHALWETAAMFGFSMRYTYQHAPKQISHYTDLLYTPRHGPWKRPPTDLKPAQQQQIAQQLLHERIVQQHPLGHFGIGRSFAFAAAYPAWQQWSRQAREPRYQKKTSPQATFGSFAASLRGMAYVGFGQNLTISPLVITQSLAAVANGGWLPAPQIWLGDWQHNTPPPQPQARKPTDPVRVLSAPDAAVLREALAAVTARGTAAQPFARLNRRCLAAYGLRIIGKTGTAEALSARARKHLLQQVIATRHTHKGSHAAFLKDTGCHQRSSWRYNYPEEAVADSLFVGAFVPTEAPATQALPSPLPFPLQDLTFAFVVKHGYHPEGAPCRKTGQDIDRSEARYLAYDTVLAILQSLGLCLTM